MKKPTLEKKIKTMRRAPRPNGVSITFGLIPKRTPGRRFFRRLNDDCLLKARARVKERQS